MAVRSPEQLRRDQAELLETYRGGRSEVGQAVEGEVAAAPPYRIGRITTVVGSDETHGPHLVVKPQSFSDRPPVIADSSGPTRIAYPTPNLSVGNYQVDEYVGLWITKGAELAVKL